MTGRCVLLVVLCLAVGAVVGAVGRGAYGSPGLSLIAGRSHDFGAVKRGERLSYSFMVPNSSGAVWRIGKVATSCGCLKATVKSSDVADGQELTLQVELDTTQQLGSLRHTAVVYFAGEETLQFDVRADVRRSTWVSGSPCVELTYAGEGNVGAIYKGTLRLEIVGDRALEAKMTWEAMDGFEFGEQRVQRLGTSVALECDVSAEILTAGGVRGDVLRGWLQCGKGRERVSLAAKLVDEHSCFAVPHVILASVVDGTASAEIRFADARNGPIDLGRIDVELLMEGSFPGLIGALDTSSGDKLIVLVRSTGDGGLVGRLKFKTKGDRHWKVVPVVLL